MGRDGHSSFCRSKTRSKRCLRTSMNHLGLSWLACITCELTELFTLHPGYELLLASTPPTHPIQRREGVGA